MKAIVTVFALLFVLVNARESFAQQDVRDTVVVRAKLPNGQFTRVDTLLEGEAFPLSGFAFPLQYLNGGELSFPDGSLREKITITIEFPPFGKIQGNAVSFGDSVASAARLLVTRRDTLISPYVFEKPIELTLPIPPTLPPAVGSKVSALALSFRDTSGKFDTTGIRTVFRDSVQKIVKAEIGHFSDIVMTSNQLAAGTSAGDTVVVRVKLPNGQFTRVDTLVEGQTFSFSGFAFPLQYLNGGQLKFPDGSLNERITLTIEIPDWAKIVGNTIGFGDSVASAARLLVTRRDTLISPYAFEKPVELTLPIRSSLPPAVGSQVSKFVLTFRKTDGKFDTTGIRTAIRDSVLKIVKAEVSHFSDVAMTSSDLLDAPTSVETDRAVIPSNFVLYQNYPNPFNPSTVIRYGIPSRAHVNLVVYTLIGQQVATLVDQIQEPGMHTVAFNAGPLPSGVYVVTLRADSFRESRRIILLR